MNLATTFLEMFLNKVEVLSQKNFTCLASHEGTTLSQDHENLQDVKKQVCQNLIINMLHET